MVCRLAACVSLSVPARHKCVSMSVIHAMYIVLAREWEAVSKSLSLFLKN